MLSIQTNVNSLVAQENLSVNNAFQSKTIQRLTSGYRINSSADDAAGLAVANKFRNNVAELTQGVQNANDGVGQLQIIDGGLTNISNILDRLQTLATESASSTFTGNRSTLNNEYQSLLGEINRQATNVNLDSNGSFKTQLAIYIGGASSANSNAEVGVDLSQAAVDTKGLALTGSSVLGGGTGFGALNTTALNDTQGLFDVGAGGGANHEDFTIAYVDANGAAQQQTVSVDSKATGYTGTAFVSALNSAITTAGINGVTAQIGGGGTLEFQGSGAFTVTHSVTGVLTAPSVAAGAVQSLVNTAENNVTTDFVNFTEGGGTVTAHQSENLQVVAGGKNYNITLTSDAASANYAGTQDLAISVMNSALAGSGVTAIKDGAGHISMQGSANFTVNVTGATAGTTSDTATFTGNLFGGGALPSTGAQSVMGANAAASATGNALSAINSVASALQTLGQVQGRVGAGENQLNYAISLAQSQITNFSSADSQIRDANVAAEAANLSKSQVLQQTSIAAMAQANSAPQQVLTLLRG